jgi:hypothetical protein
MKAVLIENVNAVVLAIGFLALEVGIAAQWSPALAGVVGGVFLIACGSWPYVLKSFQVLRRRT